MDDETMSRVGQLLPSAYEYLLKISENKSLKNMMVDLLGATDEAMLEVDRTSSCKKGCEMCCYDKVYLTTTEKVILDHYVKKNKIHPDPVNNKPWSERKFAEYKCRYLKNGECQVYDARPFVCRTHNSSDDPSLCKVTGYDEEQKAMKKTSHNQGYPLELWALYMAFQKIEMDKKGKTELSQIFL